MTSERQVCPVCLGEVICSCDGDVLPDGSPVRLWLQSCMVCGFSVTHPEHLDPALVWEVIEGALGDVDEMEWIATDPRPTPGSDGAAGA